MAKQARAKNLRQQVVEERKRRNLLFFTIAAAALIYLGITLLAGNMGFFKYRELKKAQHRLERDISTLEEENRTLERHVTALKEDRFYIEKYAREEYGLAKPDEYIFQFKEDAR